MDGKLMEIPTMFLLCSRSDSNLRYSFGHHNIRSPGSLHYIVHISWLQTPVRRYDLWMETLWNPPCDSDLILPIGAPYNHSIIWSSPQSAHSCFDHNFFLRIPSLSDLGLLGKLVMSSTNLSWDSDHKTIWSIFKTLTQLQHNPLFVGPWIIWSSFGLYNLAEPCVNHY